MDVNLTQAPETSASLPPAAPDTNSSACPAIEFLVANSSPAPRPKRWRFLPRCADIRRLQLSLFELELHLRAGVTGPQPVGADKVVPGAFSDQLLRLFSRDKCNFVVERDETQRACGLYNENGTLFLAEPPAVTRALARVDGEPKTKATPLLVVETIEDLHVSRGLGFTAVLSTGLQTLSYTQVEKLFGPDKGRDGGFRYHLIVPDWSIAELRLSSPTRAGAILQHLALMQQRYSHDPGRRFSQWRPSIEARDSIREAITFQDVERVRQLMQSSFPEAKLGLVWRRPTKPAPVTYIEARSQLQSLMAQSGDIPLVAEVTKSLQQFRKVFHDEVLAGIYERAKCAKSSLERGTIIQFAELQEQWFELQNLVRAAQQVMAGNHPGIGWERDDDDFNQRLRLNSMLLRYSSSLKSAVQ